MIRMARVFGSGAVAVTLVMPQPSQAESLDDIIGTLQVANQAIVNEGKLTGCSLVFSALVRDTAYHAGNHILVSGSATIFHSDPNRDGAMVKIVVEEVSPNGGASTPSPPSRVYIIDKNFKTNLESVVRSQPTEVPGGFVAIYNPLPSYLMIMEGISSGKLTFAFNQNNGSMDVQVPIELNVVSTDRNGVRVRSFDTTTQFADCVVKLAPT